MDPVADIEAHPNTLLSEGYFEDAGPNTTDVDIIELSEPIIVNCSVSEAEYFNGLKEFYVTERFFVFVIFGDIVAFTGIALNLFLLAVLLLRTRRRIKYNDFLLALDVMDIAILVLYILVISNGILYDYAASIWLYRMWYYYVCPLFVASRIVQVSQTYLIVVVSLERFLDIRNADSKCLQWIQHNRKAIILSIVAFAFLFKGSSYWEFDVEIANDCEGFSSKRLIQTELTQNQIYKNVYTVWLTPIFQVYLPFALLLVFNALIVYKYRRMTKCNIHVQVGCNLALLPMSTATSGSKQRAQDAMRTTVAIVSCYLFSNILSLALSFVEQMCSWLLNDNYMFYLFISDITSLMVVVVSSSRFPTYLLCNRMIFKESQALATQCRACCSKNTKTLANSATKKSITKEYSLPDSNGNSANHGNSNMLIG